MYIASHTHLLNVVCSLIGIGCATTSQEKSEWKDYFFDASLVIAVTSISAGGDHDGFGGEV